MCRGTLAEALELVSGLWLHIDESWAWLHLFLMGNVGAYLRVTHYLSNFVV